ncbi:MAG: hypothetical protein KA064_02840 [Firmicutes bacterium]|nr:hypothetical protein [Bacillota bacterium]
MPKQIYFDAAVFIQVALKSQWQDSVLRREAIGPDGTPLMPPRFGEKIGYCPTFLMADEAQQSATPKDAEFKAVCRSKRASMWELTQSHGSIKGAFGPNNQARSRTTPAAAAWACPGWSTGWPPTWPTNVSSGALIQRMDGARSAPIWADADDVAHVVAA